MKSLAVYLSSQQPNHPDVNLRTSAPYGYEWVEVVVEAESFEGLPVLIPSDELYIHSARETWSVEDDVNSIWAMLSWGEFPTISLTPPEPEESSSSDDLEIPEYNQ